MIGLTVAIVAMGLGYVRLQYARKKAKREKTEQTFKNSRRYLSENRQVLARDILAASYNEHAPEPYIPLIFGDGWLPNKPLPLQSVRIALHSNEDSCPPEKPRPPYDCRTYVNLLYTANSIWTNANR